ncbi:Mx [Charleville virus]|uniref:Mx n=1 Tax=Charleville virus TaxID=318842 RepID=A0A3Q8TND4_9RHAB|nr:Mx [Charleville virus]AZL49336.1 Mx [Charleville virus]
MFKIAFEYVYPLLLSLGKYTRRKLLRFLVISYGVDGDILENEENPRRKIVCSISTFVRELGATDEEFYTAAVENMLQEVRTLR